MLDNEVKISGTYQRIYSGAYLVAKGYNRAIEEGGDLIIEISPCHWNRRYMKPFGSNEQFSSHYQTFHHTSDIHAIVEYQLVEVGERKAGMYYIPAYNTDYFPHPRTEIRRNRMSGGQRGLAPIELKKKIFTVIGHRPRGKNPALYDILNEDIYKDAKDFFKAVFYLAINKYGKGNVILITNGTIGYAQLAQYVAISVGIEVWLHVPFNGFYSVWGKREIFRFKQLASKSLLTDLGMGDQPNNKIKSIKRSSILMIDRADQVLSVYNEKINDEVRKNLVYACSRKKHITNFNPIIKRVKDDYTL